MSYISTRVWLIEVFPHLPRILDSCYQRCCNERRRDCEDWLILWSVNMREELHSILLPLTWGGVHWIQWLDTGLPTSGWKEHEKTELRILVNWDMRVVDSLQVKFNFVDNINYISFNWSMFFFVTVAIGKVCVYMSENVEKPPPQRTKASRKVVEDIPNYFFRSKLVVLCLLILKKQMEQRNNFRSSTSWTMQTGNGNS